MSNSTHETRSNETSGDGTAPAWMTILPMISAAIMIGFWLVHAAGLEDTEALESPLILSVTRQLIVGPGGLYGPFSGSNPLVLIHAPLYYRLSAMAAWPWAHSGVHPVTAARLAGRTLSILGAHRDPRRRLSPGTARRRFSKGGPVGGPADRRGAVARRTALRGAAGHDGSGISNRRGPPGALGLEGRGSPRSGVIGAYAAFGLAACVKQNLVVGAAISLALLILAWLRGRVQLRSIAAALAVGTGIVMAVYGGEWIITDGRIWDSAFVVASQVNRVHPGGWDHVGIMILAVSNDSIGLITLLIGDRSWHGRGLAGFGRRVMLIGRCRHDRHHPRHADPPLDLATGGSGRHRLPGRVRACVALIIPACALIERSAFLGGGSMRPLWLYAAAEFASATVFFYMSEGSWKNYAIQSVVFGAILTARAASRLIDTPPSARSSGRRRWHWPRCWYPYSIMFLTPRC